MSLDQSSFPDTWKVVPISSVVFFQEGPGVRKFQYTDSGVKLLNGGNINNGLLSLSTTERYISEEEAYGKYKHFLVEDRDLLIACSGVVVDKFDGKIAYANKADLPLCMNTSTMRFQSLNCEILHLDYFRWFLQTLYFKRQLQQLITGSAQLNFGPSHIKQMTIPLPPLEIQKQIATVLEKADQLRKDCKQMEQDLNSLAQSVFIDMFGPKAKDYSSWASCKIEELAANKKGSMRTGPFGSDLKHSEFVGSGIAVIGIDNAVKNEFSWGERRFITQEKYEKLKRYRVYPKDLIITIMGTTGRIAVIPADIPLSISTKHLAVITLDETKVLPEFLATAIKTHPDILNQIRDSNKGAIMDGLNLTLIKAITIRLPPLNLQLQFLRKLKQAQERIIEARESYDVANDLFNALIQKAFKGELNLDRPAT